jgi:hypothetical protein
MDFICDLVLIEQFVNRVRPHAATSCPPRIIPMLAASGFAADSGLRAGETPRSGT